MAALQREVKAAQLRRDSQLGAINKEVELLQKRLYISFRKKEIEITEGIEVLTAQKNALGSEIKEAKQQKDHLEGDVLVKRNRLIQLEYDIQAKVPQLTLANERTEQLIANVEALEKAIKGLEVKKSKLEFMVTNHQAETADYDRQISEKQAKIVQLDTDYDTRKKKIDAQLREALLKTETAVQQLKQYQETEDAMRSELADEKKRLEKREEVVQRREILADRGLSKIQDSERFMNL